MSLSSSTEMLKLEMRATFNSTLLPVYKQNLSLFSVTHTDTERLKRNKQREMLRKQEREWKSFQDLILTVIEKYEKRRVNH